MKITKKIEAEIKQFMNTYWDTYLKGDIKKWAAFIPEDYKNIGTNQEEIWNSKKEIIDYTHAVLDQMAGVADLRNKQTQIISYDPYLMVQEVGDLYVKIDGAWAYYAQLRLSSLIQKNKKGWMVLHQHGSFPDSKTQKGEAFAFDTLKAENRKLQVAVENRTAELVLKNRELEIETALERVRTVAMAMNKPEDLLHVCKSIYTQLQKLGFRELRNSMINVYNEADASFLNHDYSGEAGPSTIYFKYDSHPVIINMMKELRKKRDAFAPFSLTGKKLKDFIRFREMNGEKTDLKLKKATALHYYFYSIGDGAIGISTLKAIDENQIKILKRFRNVFDLAYKRYTDITHAEAQAREAKIEGALEKVRSHSLAMHKSDELIEVANLLRKEMTLLGVEELETCSIYLVNTNQKTTECWYAIKDVRGKKAKLVSDEMTLDLSATWVGRQMKKFYQSEKNYTSIEMKGNNRIDWINNCASRSKVLKGYYGKSVPDRTYHLVKFPQGYVGAATPGSISAESWSLLTRATAVFSFAYTRFLDLQKAETQAREAQIEAALEKVRSRSMAMHHSSELGEVAAVLFSQISLLSKTPNRFNIGIVNEKEKAFDIWLTDQKGHSVNQRFVGYASKSSVIASMFQAWKSKKKQRMENLHGSRLKSWLKYMHGELGIPFDMKRVTEHRYINSIFFSHGFMGTTTNEPIQAEVLQLLERFTKVFEQTYTRFLDLKKAEAQAREAEIELALERVRARSMAMHNSDEFKEVIQVVYEQFVHLNIHIEHTGFILDYKERDDMFIWLADKQEIQTQITLPYFDCAHWNSFIEAKKKGKDFFANQLTYKEKNKFYRDLFKFIPDLSKEAKEYYLSASGLAISTVLLDNVGLYIENFSGTPYSDEENKILMRFGKIFQQTYTRFLDLQKAEAQAREAQIEAGLERVRSKTMAMHNSQDVGNTVVALFDELVVLGLEKTARCGIGILDESPSMELWSASVNAKKELVFAIGTLNMTLHPLLVGVKDAWSSKKQSFSYELNGKDLINYYKTLNNAPDYTFYVDLKTLPKKIIQNSFSFADGVIFSFTTNPISADFTKVFKRFAAVFGQTYKRYLDLKKAEAQAREAQIEAALERVRAQAMAMHNTEDLGKTIEVYYEQLDSLLSSTVVRCGAGLLNKENTFAQMSTASRNHKGEIYHVMGTIDMNGHPLLDSTYDHWLRQEEHNYVLRGNEIREYYQYITNQVAILNSEVDELNFYFPMFAEGSFYVVTNDELPENELQIFRRFSSVLSLTYRRFNDLQKAEAQAREAQIEAALERVRSRSMAMQHSNELNKVLSTMFGELSSMGLALERCIIWTFNMEDRSVRWWAANPEVESGTESFLIPYTDHPTCNEYWKAWRERRTRYLYELSGETKKTWDEYLFNHTEMARLPEPVKRAMMAPEKVFLYNTFRDFGVLFPASLEHISEENFDIVERFGKVFDQSYTRFKDIQQAEAREKEAIKQSSLDRVRGEIASMRTTQDLERITPLVWKELTTLGVPFFRCGIFIIKEDEQMVHAYLSTPAGKSLGALHIGFEEKEIGMIGPAIENWRNQNTYAEEWDQIRFVENMNRFIERGLIESSEQYQAGAKPPEKLVLHLVPFKQGMLYVGNSEQLIPEHINLMQDLASAFAVAYSRYEDFIELEIAKASVDAALSDLKSTQSQLIQSEKMASLGELTAGIAHEIQNPLNFVNNFSEVSNEMIKEILDTRHKTQVKNRNEEEDELLNDIASNLEKINHHGKRAGDIVKGMLQHSRAGSGKKEPTDINALCDEYLRLAYHGLRAKDKSFNAKFETDFDSTIEKINVVPQDIGRVVLNLITNAFYVVNEKSKQCMQDYDPAVIVSTKKSGGRVLISVKDNGNGISDHIKEKIFQPFFTTKPTGQGTGLGLSLSYDIVKAHGGELKVETKPIEVLPPEATMQAGSEFVIQLPVL